MEQLEWVAKKLDGTADVVVGSLPTMPARLKVLEAYQDASGYATVQVNVLDDEGNPTGEVQDEVQQVRDVQTDDLVAVVYAVLGLCWQQPPLPVPSFRDCGRDVVEFGEQFQTVLMESGYSMDGLPTQAAKVYAALERSVYKAMGLIREEADFSEAQEQS